MEDSKNIIKTQDKFEMSFKVILLGEIGVGKTSVLFRYTENKF
jgi:GTPase SAR1 family protein